MGSYRLLTTFEQDTEPPVIWRSSPELLLAPEGGKEAPQPNDKEL